jgi:hypothetical protein
MNKQIERFARRKLIEGLLKCSDKQQTFFKRMYSQDSMSLSVVDVVANMSCDDLDWAMTQVDNTLKKTSNPTPEKETK